ncbi:hypothetical protein CC79DRAFT_1363598 [Sarocladium strictum]
MSIQILSCPAAVEAFVTFTVVLGNAQALPEQPFAVEMTMISETETLITAGQSDKNFVGEEVLQGDICRSARFSFHPLRFLPEAANRTWTVKFKIVDLRTEDVITIVRQDIRVVLPPTAGDDVKLHQGVKRKTTHGRATNV